MAIFYESRANEQHSFLFRLCGKGVLYPAIPHIYSSVGYCIVYLIRVSHNLLLDRRNNLTLSLFYIDSILGLSGRRFAMCTSTISLKESYINELKEKILLYAKNNGMKQEEVSLETIIHILIEIRLARLKREKRPLFVENISMDESDYNFLSEILIALSTEVWQITDERPAERKDMLKQEAKKQLSQK